MNPPQKNVSPHWFVLYDDKAHLGHICPIFDIVIHVIIFLNDVNVNLSHTELKQNVDYIAL